MQRLPLFARFSLFFLFFYAIGCGLFSASPTKAAVCLFRTRESDNYTLQQKGVIVPLCNDSADAVQNGASCSKLCPSGGPIYACTLMNFANCPAYEQSVNKGDIPGARGNIYDDPHFCSINGQCSTPSGPESPSTTPTTTNPTRSAPQNYDGPIPNCAFTYEGCRELNDLLRLLVNVGDFIFKIIGTVAFVFFIYGGVTMIAAFGSPEKFQKGRDILVAAVIGLIVAFSAYLLIQFLLETLGVSADLRSIK